MDGTKLLAMSVEADGISANLECRPAEVGYYLKGSGSAFHNTFVPCGVTTTWCWQQGCMLQWNPQNPSEEVIYNCLVNNQYGSTIRNINTNQRIIDFSRPVYSVSSTGNRAVSLNFSRLGRLRPGYGYSALADTSAGQPAPSDDGMYLMDLSTGKSELLISLQRLATEVHCDADSQHYINHATFSPDGNSLAFFHLWHGNNGRQHRFCAINIHTGKLSVLESLLTVSHYCWKGPQEILATALDASGNWNYFHYNLATESRESARLPLKGDGHPMFCPSNPDIIISDTYPDLKRDQHLFIANLKTKEAWDLAAFFSPSKYSGQIRCDLHPRWSPQGDAVIVDFISFNQRKIGVFSIKSHVS